MHTQRIIHMRIYWCTGAVLCALSIIVARLVNLQIMHQEYYLQRSMSNFLRTVPIYPCRGAVLDRHGVPLATNKPIVSIYWKGSGNRIISAEQQELCNYIRTIIPTALRNDEAYAQLVAAERATQQYLICSNIALDVLAQLLEQFPHHPNVHIDIASKRYYPYCSYAAQIIGYLHNSTTEQYDGKSGLEKILQPQLQGHIGSSQKIVTSSGKEIMQTMIHDAQAGNDIQTTIDVSLQHICETIFPSTYTGTMIVMDPDEGDILALVSRPSFDPSLFAHGLTTQQWHSLQALSQPFLNRASNGTYPPGSVFKLVSISAALEYGLVTPETEITCRGYSVFCDRRYWCHQRYGHGKLTLRNAIAQSCNILFFDLAKQGRLTIDMLAQYAYKFGLGSATGVLIPEKVGLVPNRAWKRMVKNEPWWPGETLSVSIGQGYLLVTPLQIARMIGSIFTHTLVKPRILRDEPIERELLSIRPETCTILQRSMKSVITKGTGKKISRIKDIEIYAKTSTAQNISYSDKPTDDKYKEHGWFVAYIRAPEQPPYVLLILVEHAGSSKIATRTAYDFLIAYKKMLAKN